MILFAAIPIPFGPTRDLERLQKGVSGARWRPPESFHVTLAYFGDCTDDQAEELDRNLAARGFPAFEMALRGAGHFGSNPPRSLWMGVEDTPELDRLNAHCKRSARQAGIPVERRVWRPHVTLAYLRETALIDRVIRFEQRLARWQGEPFLVDEFQLWSSHRRKSGPNAYRVEATYPLLG